MAGGAMSVDNAWSKWWSELGHVARCNRDPARTREAFEAGYLAAIAYFDEAHAPEEMQGEQNPAPPLTSRIRGEGKDT